jgi:predicted GNAT family N-acyltransferase
MISSSRDRFDLNFSEIHEAVFPADVRSQDRIVARIKKRESEASFHPIQVWKVSPLGVELVDDPDQRFRKGDKVDLEIVIGGQRTYFEGLVVVRVIDNEAIRLIGIRLSNKRKSYETDGEKRRSVRWLCSEDFYPTCVSPTPGRYNEYIYFQIRDISKEGFQLQCSLRNKYLIPGTHLNLTASFPMVGDLSLPVRVARISISSERGKDYLVVGTEFINLSQATKNIIGQYLLQFTDAENLDELREAGFFPSSMAKGTDFYFLKSELDYEEVLNLRLKAHQAGGTIDETARAPDMGDIFDTNSRIVVGRHNGEVIASARIHFNVLEEDMEHERHFKWPPELPRRDQIFEITRVCTHPKFRSADLLASLLQFISATCLQPQRPWVLVSSTDNLLPFYEKLGMKSAGITYEHPTYKGNQNVLLSNAYDILLGKSTHPLYWNVVWKDVHKYLVDSGVLIPDPMDRARIRAYKLMAPISKLFYRFARKPRSKPR